MNMSTNMQYSLAKIIGLWLLVTVPMGLEKFWLMPLMDGHPTIHPGIIFWLLMIAGMIWQWVLSMIILKIELDGYTHHLVLPFDPILRAL